MQAALKPDDHRFTPQGETYTDAKARIRATYTEAFYAVKMARSSRRGPCAFLHDTAHRANYPTHATVTLGYTYPECEVWEERNGPAPHVADLPEG